MPKISVVHLSNFNI